MRVNIFFSLNSLFSPERVALTFQTRTADAPSTDARLAESRRGSSIPLTAGKPRTRLERSNALISKSSRLSVRCSPALERNFCVEVETASGLDHS